MKMFTTVKVFNQLYLMTPQRVKDENLTVETFNCYFDNKGVAVKCGRFCSVKFYRGF